MPGAGWGGSTLVSAQLNHHSAYPPSALLLIASEKVFCTSPRTISATNRPVPAATLPPSLPAEDELAAPHIMLVWTHHPTRPPVHRVIALWTHSPKGNCANAVLYHRRLQLKTKSTKRKPGGNQSFPPQEKFRRFTTSDLHTASKVLGVSCQPRSVIDFCACHPRSDRWYYDSRLGAAKQKEGGMARVKGIVRGVVSRSGVGFEGR